MKPLPAKAKGYFSLTRVSVRGFWSSGEGRGAWPSPEPPGLDPLNICPLPFPTCFHQIYNEMIRDLLNPALGYLELREDSKGVIQVAGITEVSTINAKEASLYFFSSIFFLFAF